MRPMRPARLGRIAHQQVRPASRHDGICQVGRVTPPWDVQPSTVTMPVPDGWCYVTVDSGVRARPVESCGPTVDREAGAGR